MVRRRLHEFSPSDRWAHEGSYGSVTQAMMRQLGLESAELGGAPRFLSFLTDELLPFVTREYRAAPDQLGLLGDSAGGTFALYALLSGRAPFRKYICGSPATAQCDDELFRMEERYAAANRDLDAKVFLAAGAEEMSSAFLEGGGIASGVARFAGLFALRRYPSLRVTSTFFPEEGHLSVIPAIVSRGLRTLWATGRRYGDPLPSP
jgi:uncharacterized protein